jgi:hypothetical protein
MGPSETPRAAAATTFMEEQNRELKDKIQQLEKELQVARETVRKVEISAADEVRAAQQAALTITSIVLETDQAVKTSLQKVQAKMREDVLKDIKRALEPNDSFSLARRGDAYHVQGKLDEALKDIIATYLRFCQGMRRPG